MSGIPLPHRVVQRTPDMPQDVVIPKGKSIIPLAWDPAPAGPSQEPWDLSETGLVSNEILVKFSVISTEFSSFWCNSTEFLENSLEFQ